MNSIFITTTGATPSVILSDLGYRVITHPTTNYNLGSEFTYTELAESGDFNNSLTQGYLTASYNGTIITSAISFQPSIGGYVVTSSSPGATGPTGANGATGSQGIQGATGSTGATGSPFLNGLTSSLQYFTSSNDTNVNLNISSSGSTHSFNVTWNGVLPITRGGSGTNSVFTQGSVLFVGPGGNYFQDSTNFYWNDSLNRLGVGTTSPIESITTTGNILSSGVYLWNPSKTFEYQIIGTAISADRILSLPLLTTNDTFVFTNMSQTLLNKSLSGGTVSGATLSGVTINTNLTITGTLSNSRILNTLSGGTVSGVTVSNSTLLSSTNTIEATRLQTFTVSSATPSTNNILSWNGSSWSPTANITVTQVANTASQAMGTNYAVLTGMTSSKGSGTYVVTFSGFFALTVDSQAAVTMYIDNTEVGNVNGYTYREFGTIASNGSDTWDGSVHTQAFVTLSGTQSINIRGKNITSTGNTFVNGSMIIMKIT